MSRRLARIAPAVLPIAAVLFLVLCASEALAQVDPARVRSLSGGAIALLSRDDQVRVCAGADRDHRGLKDSTVTFAMTVGIYDWCIPEYHDDQRFHDGGTGSNEYGPVAHTLAHPRVATLLDHTAFDTAYIHVAIVDLDSIEPSMPAPYRRLHLDQLHSCMYLKHSHPSGRPVYYRAMMLPAASGSCPTNPSEDSTKTLEVRVEKYSDNLADYPPVTRFVEGNNGNTLVSVMCANRWCVVGPRAIGVMPSHAHSTTTTPNVPQNRVKGWFDDQVLGVPDGSPRYRIHRQHRASLMPDTLLGTYTITMYKAGYLHVANAYFPKRIPDSAKYASKFHFRKGTNAIEIMAVDTTIAGTATTLWMARINGDTTRRYKVMRTDHSAVLKSVPATARFRWKDSDEDVWVACEVGCCLINGDTY